MQEPPHSVFTPHLVWSSPPTPLDIEAERQNAAEAAYGDPLRANPDPQAGPLSPPCVLIVGAFDGAAHILSAQMAAAGFCVKEAVDSEAALDTLFEADVDVALMDAASVEFEATAEHKSAAVLVAARRFLDVLGEAAPCVILIDTTGAVDADLFAQALEAGVVDAASWRPDAPGALTARTTARIQQRRARRPAESLERQLKEKVRLRTHELAKSHADLIHEISRRARVERDLKRARFVAERASLAKTQFLAHISHELRTPLNAIIGFSEVLRGDSGVKVDPEQTRGYLGMIHDSGLRLLDMINNILELIRLESEVAPPSRDVYAAADVMDRLLSVARSRVDPKLFELIEPESPDETWRVSPELLARGVRGLIDNAVAAARTAAARRNVGVLDATDCAKIEIRIERNHGGLRLVVLDPGDGADPEELARLTEPFAQTEDIYIRRDGGLGLGLPIARRAAEIHGGALQIARRPEGGMRVALDLPPECIENMLTDIVSEQEIGRSLK